MDDVPTAEYVALVKKIRAARLKDQLTLAEWKAANKELTNLNEQMRKHVEMQTK